MEDFTVVTVYTGRPSHCLQTVPTEESDWRSPIVGPDTDTIIIHKGQEEEYTVNVKVIHCKLCYTIDINCNYKYEGICFYYSYTMIFFTQIMQKTAYRNDCIDCYLLSFLSS